VIDPNNDSVIATIKGGEKMEYAVSDDEAAIYVAGEEKGDLLRIDTRTNGVSAQWAASGCESPHGLAIDRTNRRLFMGCTNGVMMVMDADDGHVVAKLDIGRGNDAVAYDPVRRRIFSSNGIDGTVTVYQQSASDGYTALDPIPTVVSGRTMSIDPASGRLFVAAADIDPTPAADGRKHARPGTLRLLVFEPTYR
jgi:DNA-binding beta-propeller fold protein YncE